MTWINEHLESILAIWGAFVTFASTIIKITPTTKDDTILDKIVSFVELFSIFSKKETTDK